MEETQKGSKSLNRDTLDFIWSHTKDAPENQLRGIDSLDTKMFQAFSVATVILGLTGFAVGQVQKDYVMVGLLGAVIMAYLFVAVFALRGLRVQMFRRSLQADVLWQEHWHRDVADVKHSVVADIAEAYAHNKKALDKKARTLNLSLVAMSFEAVFVGAVFVGALWGA